MFTNKWAKLVVQNWLNCVSAEMQWASRVFGLVVSLFFLFNSHAFDADKWWQIYGWCCTSCRWYSVAHPGKSMGNGDCEQKLFYAQINCTPSKQVNQAKMPLTHVPTKCSTENQHAISIGIFIHTNRLPTTTRCTECKTPTRTIWSVFHAWNTFCSVVCGLDIICCFYFVWLVVGILCIPPSRI